MKARVAVAVLLLAAVAAAGVIRLAIKRQASDHGVIKVSGNIEVTLAEASFKIPGRVLQRFVDEGQMVTNGQPVAVLDRVELEQDLAMRRAELEAAEAILAELEAGTRVEEIQQAEAALEMARVESVRLKAEFARAKEMLAQKVVAPRDYELAEAAYQVAAARVREGEARLALLKHGPREETVRAARARVEQARQGVGLAETRHANATLVTPLSGVVMAKGVENGEYVSPGTPVVTVGDLSNVWVRAYLDERDLGRVRVGQTVKVTADTYPGRVYEGRLSFLSPEAEFTPKNIQTAKERVKLVYRIKVDVTNPDQELKPGMPVDAELSSR